MRGGGKEADILTWKESVLESRAELKPRKLVLRQALTELTVFTIYTAGETFHLKSLVILESVHTRLYIQ